MLQAGRIGLWQAVLHFNAERGVAFSSYACVTIERKVRQAVRRNGRPQGLPISSAPVNLCDLAGEMLWQAQVQPR